MEEKEKWRFCSEGGVYNDGRGASGEQEIGVLEKGFDVNGAFVDRGSLGRRLVLKRRGEAGRVVEAVDEEKALRGGRGTRLGRRER